MGRYSRSSRYSSSYWPRYVSVGERRLRATREIAELRKEGRKVSPVEIKGRKIATTFWGDAWCKNLEAYSDFANRLPRGRSYVRHGTVIDLEITSGRVRALVCGSDLYEVELKMKPLPGPRWRKIKGQCAGEIGSLMELLGGSISDRVMEIVTRKGEGLFPSPREISLGCSCPDWATMCKHVAAMLYGVGARLDHAPELLFTLRGVDPAEMVEAAIEQPVRAGKGRRGRVLEAGDVSSVFGVDIDLGDEGEDDTEVSRADAPAGRSRRAARGRKAVGAKASVRRRAAGNGEGKTTKKGAKKAARKKVAKKAAVRKSSAGSSAEGRRARKA